MNRYIKPDNQRLKKHMGLWYDSVFNAYFRKNIYDAEIDFFCFRMEACHSQ